MLEHLHPTPIAPSRAVVMGAGGFIGGAIAAGLEARSVPVLRLTRQQVDLGRPDGADRLTALLRPSDVFVAVSAIAPVKNLAMLRDNITLLDAMVAALGRVPPAHLLNIGSDAVFGDEPYPLTEASAKAPGSLHGIMHAAREVAFAEIKAPVATLRPTLVYGTRDPHNGYGPNRFRRLAAEGQDIVLFGEGEERRDHVFIDDVAELAVRMVLQRSTGSLNAASGQVWSFREVASMVVGHFPRPVPILSSPRQGPMPHNGYRPFDVAATRAAFPDFRYTPLPEGLAKLHNENMVRGTG